ncbi:MAG TPA: 30S ribosomal protein S6 [Solirubrobacteraceae bacterium]|nr:30S ribosomal protein S6 [Solirubrobacteraceae bacterium]
MAALAPTYDLVMLLDPQAQEDARAKILADTRETIAAKGELTREDEWGDRALAYPIERKTDAEYHLLQFTAATPELLGELSRTLRITDGVLRFRIVKLEPGTPDAPDMRPSAASARPAEAPAATPATSAAPAEVAEVAAGEPAEAAPAEAVKAAAGEPT